jgi:bacterial/archaeal transporter family-2 protein
VIVLVVLVAIAVGAASTVQGVSNGLLSSRLGLTSAVLLNGAIVFAGSLALWLLLPRGDDPTAPPVPWYLYLGGVYGLAIVAGAAFCFPRLGAGPATAVLVASMLIVSLAFDQIGPVATRLPVTPMRVMGAVLLLVGAVLVLWPKIALPVR